MLWQFLFGSSSTAVFLIKGGSCSVLRHISGPDSVYCFTAKLSAKQRCFALKTTAPNSRKRPCSTRQGLLPSSTKIEMPSSPSFVHHRSTLGRSPGSHHGRGLPRVDALSGRPQLRRHSSQDDVPHDAAVCPAAAAAAGKQRAHHEGPTRWQIPSTPAVHATSTGALGGGNKATLQP